jgi:hypothetical protein
MLRHAFFKRNVSQNFNSVSSQSNQQTVEDSENAEEDVLTNLSQAPETEN